MARGTDITQFKRKYRERNEGDFPESFPILLTKESDLKYGENPGQQAAVYRLAQINEVNSLYISGSSGFKYARTDDQGKGGLSLTNQMDISRAMDVLKYSDNPTVVIMKHNIVSGYAKGKELLNITQLFRQARDADRRSNFGGTAVFNRPLNIETAAALFELKGSSPFFVDVLAAIGYESGVLDYIQSQSKNMRIAKIFGVEELPRFHGDNTYGLVSLKDMPTGRVGVQTLPLTSIKGKESLVLDPVIVDEKGSHTINRDPTERELEDLLTAWWINVSGVRSNGIVFVKNGVSVAIGSGQVERVGAVEQAIVKGMQKAMDREGISYDPLMGMQGWEKLKENPFEGAAMSSDAFFPDRDSIDRLGRVGVSAVIQPYGSIKDASVIDAANEHWIAMPATLERCFGHF